MFRIFFRLLRGALIAAYENGCLGTAKGAAYSALMAFFPLLATLAAILGYFQASFVSRQLSRFLAEILPPGTHDLVFQYFPVRGNHPYLIPLTAMLVSVWVASGVIVSLTDGFRAAYRIPAERPFVQQRTVALLLVLSAAIPTLVASLLILFGVRAERWLIQALGWLPAGAELHGRLRLLTALVRVPVALGAIALGAAILYRFGPNRPLTWRRVWPGSVLATVLWLGATTLFAWYAGHIANYNVVYGSVAAVILLLVWMYVLAVIALIGCEFNAQCEK